MNICVQRKSTVCGGNLKFILLSVMGLIHEALQLKL